MPEHTLVEPDFTSAESGRLSVHRFALWAALVVLLFSVPLYQLVRFSFFSKQSDFFSYIPLIPFVSAYLLWIGRGKLPKRTHPAIGAAAVFSFVGLTLAGACFFYRHSLERFGLATYLAPMTLAFLLTLVGGILAIFGMTFLRAAIFPVGMLLFLVPPPEAFLGPLTAFLQVTSAVASSSMFGLAGTAHLRTGTVLQLPNISLEVAPECSGLHSTMVLLITSFLAGYLFLRSPWRRALLVLVVLPLAILRNGFRVFVIGELCVHISPSMIDSPIHHQGGPIFFALSLVPFFLLLFYLRKQEEPSHVFRSAR